MSITALTIALGVLAAAGPNSAGPRPAVFAERHRGVCWVAAGPLSGAELEPLERLGAGWIAQTPFGWMSSPDDPRVKLVTGSEVYWGESDAGLIETTRLARAAGLRTALKPHIWIHGSWPGAVRMPDEAAWRRWFTDYTRFILHYARLAQENGIELLVIGTELRIATRERPEDWRRLIGEVRAVYDGAVTYAANWDEVWDLHLHLLGPSRQDAIVCHLLYCEGATAGAGIVSQSGRLTIARLH